MLEKIEGRRRRGLQRMRWLDGITDSMDMSLRVGPSRRLSTKELMSEGPVDSKEIKPVNHKGNQSGIFTGRTDAEAETLILWPPDAKNWLTGKDPDAGKD